jgi:hypothetical protein
MRFRFTQNDSALSKASRYQRLDELGLGLVRLWTFLAAMGFAFLGGAYARPTAPDLMLTVRVYNYAQSPSTLLVEAEHEASRILGEAGLKSVWLDCPLAPSADIPQSPCPEPIGAAEVRLRILSVPVRNGFHDTAFGFAIVPALASVYYESVLDFAKYDQAVFEAPIVLGCVIAHEIGHLLLGSNNHSASGIMRARWERGDIQEALMGAMRFTPKQARLMQAEANKRTTSAPENNLRTKSPKHRAKPA